MRATESCSAEENKHQRQIVPYVEPLPSCDPIRRRSKTRVNRRATGQDLVCRCTHSLKLSSDFARRNHVEVYLWLRPRPVNICSHWSRDQTKICMHVAPGYGRQFAKAHFGGHHNVWIEFLKNP